MAAVELTGPAVPMTAEQTHVLEWADSVRRDLPWRRTRDPWSILVAEVMLQQTQVDRVVPRWTEFLRRWPDVGSCAAASRAEVLAEWSGLGYPRRASNLHESARRIAEGGGRFPDQLEDLLALPGIGPYTARAVLAFAFERDVAVVDTNVGRVLARRAGTTLRPREAQALADEWVPHGAGWEWNQGMLDLGALRCRPVPRCEACPVRPSCAWSAAGLSSPDPAVGSAAVSRRQARFEGSARQARGVLMRAVQVSPVHDAALVELFGWTARADARPAALAVAGSLLSDGLVSRDEQGRLVPPTG